MRVTIADQKYKSGEELLRCCLGDVVLGLFAPPAVAKHLTSLNNRLADFRSTEPLDLRLNIVIKSRSKKKFGKTHGDHVPRAAISEMAQKAPTEFKRKQSVKAYPFLKQLLSDPTLGDWGQKVFSRHVPAVFVPLLAGLLIVADSCTEALLLLDKECRPSPSDAPSSWQLCANISAVNAVMAFLAVYLAERGDGVIVHGTGLSRNGDGYLFLAPSGGGKTAVSMHSPPYAVLADDGIILRNTGRRYRIYPTPFRQRPGGETRQWAWQQSAKGLRALFILDKSAVTRLRPLSRAQALGALINGFTHYYMWMKPHQAVKVFDFWRRLSTMIPIASLQWRLGSDFWPEINHLLNHEKKNETKERVSALAGGL